MPHENAGEGRIQPIRVTRLTIAPGNPRGLDEGPLVIVATLDPGPDRDEQQWWTDRISELVEVRAWSGPFPGRLTSIHVEAPPGEVEAVARRLLTSIRQANDAYESSYPSWRREHDDRIAETRLREQRELSDQQAILDMVIEEHRTSGRAVAE